jgi:hypothetical protein
MGNSGQANGSKRGRSGATEPRCDNQQHVNINLLAASKAGLRQESLFRFGAAI